MLVHCGKERGRDAAAQRRLGLRSKHRGGLRAALRRLRGPLDSPGFRRLAGGKAVSYLGDWLTLAALVGWIYSVTSSTASVAALMVVRLVPPIAGGTLVASLLDRVPRERALLLGQVASASAVAGALVGMLEGSRVLVFAATALFGFCAPIGYSAASALVPRVVAQDRLAPANALLAMGQEAAMASGALAAGLMLSAGTAPAALCGALVAYAVALALYSRVRPDAASAPRARAGSGLLAGLRYVAVRPTLLLVVSGFALSTLATGLTNATLPRFLDGLGLGPGAYGFAIAALAAGFVVGEGAVGLAGARVGPRWLGYGTGAMAVLFVALALAPQPAIALALLVGIGCVNGVGEVVLPTVVQREAAPEYHGRLFGLASTAVRTTMLGAFAAAPLVNALGPPRVAILGSALVLAVVSAVVLAGTSSRRPDFVAAPGRVTARRT
jgi:Na+/melibiose symporter-like transporter